MKNKLLQLILLACFFAILGLFKPHYLFFYVLYYLALICVVGRFSFLFFKQRDRSILYTFAISISCGILSMFAGFFMYIIFSIVIQFLNLHYIPINITGADLFNFVLLGISVFIGGIVYLIANKGGARLVKRIIIFLISILILTIVLLNLISKDIRYKWTSDDRIRYDHCEKYGKRYPCGNQGTFSVPLGISGCSYIGIWLRDYDITIFKIKTQCYI